MKKNFLLAALILSLLLISLMPAFAGEEYLFTKGGEKLAFSIEAPDGWTIDDSGKNGAPLFFMGPVDQGFTINVNVILEEVGNAPTLEEYVTEAFSGQVQGIKERKVLSDEIIQVDGYNAYQAVVAYTFEVQGGEFSTKTLQTIILRKGYAYVITGSAVDGNFSKYKETFKDIVSTVKF